MLKGRIIEAELDNESLPTREKFQAYIDENLQNGGY